MGREKDYYYDGDPESLYYQTEDDLYQGKGILCQECGMINPPDTRYCDQCGRPLEAPELGDEDDKEYKDIEDHEVITEDREEDSIKPGDLVVGTNFRVVDDEMGGYVVDIGHQKEGVFPWDEVKWAGTFEDTLWVYCEDLFHVTESETSQHRPILSIKRVSEMFQQDDNNFIKRVPDGVTSQKLDVIKKRAFPNSILEAQPKTLSRTASENRPKEEQQIQLTNKTYISDIPATGYSLLGEDSETKEQILITQESRRQGLYVIGATGTGKTGLIENLILQDIHHGLGLCLLDPHGDLTNNVLSRMRGDRLKDVVLLNITDSKHPFGLNLFACSDPTDSVAVQHLVDKVMHIFEKLFDVSRQTPQMAYYLRNCTHTLVANPGYTMADIPLLLTDRECRQKLVSNVTDPQVRLFWKQYERMKPSEQDEKSMPIINKLDEFLQTPSRLLCTGRAYSRGEFERILQA